MAFWEPLNIVSELHLRDLGSFRVPGAAHRINSTFHSRQILRQVILASHRVYKPLLSSALTSPKDSLYCDGKLYLKQDQIYQCLALRDGSVVSSDELLHLYTLPATPKWEDQEMWSGSLPEFLTPPLAFNAHKSTLIVLQKDGWLTFYDGAQGQKRQSVFLSNSVNYREMVCDSESSSIVLKSTRLMMDDREEGIFIRRSRSLLSMMVFHFPPLAFTAHFSVSKHIFGSNIVDAVISHDLLIVMHSDDSLRAYSLSYIFEKFTLRHFNIGDVDESDLEFRYGQHPVGFPYNVDITHLPPCLFQVKSKQHHLQIGSFPWKYIIRESHSKCEMFNLKDETAVRHGSIEFSDDIEQDEILFHPDESPRLIHVSSNAFKIFLINSSNHSRPDASSSMEEVFQLSPFNRQGISNGLKLMTQFGRRIRQPVNYSSYFDLKQEITFDYEDELDILAVMAASEVTTDDDGSLEMNLDKIYLLDSRTYEVHRTIDLNEVVRMTSSSSMSVVMDRDLLIVRVRNPSLSTTFIYRLREPV